MRKRSAAAILLGLLLLAGNGFGDNNPLITVDENGNGTLLFPGVPAFTSTGVLAPDPGPGGLLFSLTYNLLGPPGLIAGDVILLEGGLQSDLIRFNPAGTSTGYPASLVFYSEIEGLGQLADTGLPTARYTNLLSLPEVASGTLYTPTASQPGFVPGFSVTYNFLSSEPTGVPEPAAASLLLAGTGVLIARKRWLKKRSV
jgi:hypothetical protein